jgi:hypothetical protein
MTATPPSKLPSSFGSGSKSFVNALDQVSRLGMVVSTLSAIARMKTWADFVAVLEGFSAQLLDIVMLLGRVLSVVLEPWRAFLAYLFSWSPVTIPVEWHDPLVLSAFIALWPIVHGCAVLSAVRHRRNQEFLAVWKPLYRLLNSPVSTASTESATVLTKVEAALSHAWPYAGTDVERDRLRFLSEYVNALRDSADAADHTRRRVRDVLTLLAWGHLGITLPEPELRKMWSIANRRGTVAVIMLAMIAADRWIQGLTAVPPLAVWSTLARAAAGVAGYVAVVALIGVASSFVITPLAGVIGRKFVRLRWVAALMFRFSYKSLFIHLPAEGGRAPILDADDATVINRNGQLRVEHDAPVDCARFAGAVYLKNAGEIVIHHNDLLRLPLIRPLRLPESLRQGSFRKLTLDRRGDPTSRCELGVRIADGPPFDPELLTYREDGDADKVVTSGLP